MTLNELGEISPSGTSFALHADAISAAVLRQDASSLWVPHKQITKLLGVPGQTDEGAPTSRHHVSTTFEESEHCREAHAAGTPCDECNFAVQRTFRSAPHLDSANSAERFDAKTVGRHEQLGSTPEEHVPSSSSAAPSPCIGEHL